MKLKIESKLLQEKLNGKIPITREELLILVNSWGRLYSFITNNEIEIKKHESKECYDLSKLDVSKITNMDYIFKYSLFDGDISSWDVSNVTSMNSMFYRAEKFNSDISNWYVSNVTAMNRMFYGAEKFNSNIEKWDVSNVTSMFKFFICASSFNQPLNFDTSNVTSMKKMFCHAKKFNQPLIFDTSNVVNMDYMFNDAKSFLDRYNSGKDLPYYTNEIKDWINNNRDKMNEIDIKENHGKEINDFFNIISNTKKIIF